MEDKTDNELIAEFMDTFKASDNFGRDQRFINGAPVRTIKGSIDYPYHKSWDWLMPAFSKFSNLDYEDDQHVLHCAAISEKVLAFDLFGAHECLVEGIKWYNSKA